MSHPSSCTDPDTCTLSYREHLLGIALDSKATPTRRREAVQTNTRNERWGKDMEAFRRLHKDGLTPPHIDGSDFREKHATKSTDITNKLVDINFREAGKDKWQERKFPTKLPLPSPQK